VNRPVGLRIKAFNAPLRRARVAAGYSAKGLADALGWPYWRLLDVENLKRWPDEDEQLAIAVFLQVPADALFPEELRGVTGAPTTLEIAVSVQAAAVLGQQSALDAVDPLLALENEWRREAIAEAMDNFTPRERLVITRRFGLDGGGGGTYEKLGREVGVTKERIRQIEQKALRKMRHPRHCALREFGGPTVDDRAIVSEEAAYWRKRERERTEHPA